VALEKLRRLRAVARPELLLSIDGGINPQTTALSAEAGAEMFVVGTALFSQPDYGRRMEELLGAAKSYRGVQV
jgi:ribulose-phosphate 3-epimerase